MLVFRRCVYLMCRKQSLVSHIYGVGVKQRGRQQRCTRASRTVLIVYQIDVPPLAGVLALAHPLAGALQHIEVTLGGNTFHHDCALSHAASESRVPLRKREWKKCNEH